MLQRIPGTIVPHNIPQSRAGPEPQHLIGWRAIVLGNLFLGFVAENLLNVIESLIN